MRRDSCAVGPCLCCVVLHSMPSTLATLLLTAQVAVCYRRSVSELVTDATSSAGAGFRKLRKRRVSGHSHRNEASLFHGLAAFSLPSAVSRAKKGFLHAMRIGGFCKLGSLCRV